MRKHKRKGNYCHLVSSKFNLHSNIFCSIKASRWIIVKQLTHTSITSKITDNDFVPTPCFRLDLVSFSLPYSATVLCPGRGRCLVPVNPLLAAGAVVGSLIHERTFRHLIWSPGVSRRVIDHGLRLGAEFPTIGELKVYHFQA